MLLVAYYCNGDCWQMSLKIKLASVVLQWLTLNVIKKQAFLRGKLNKLTSSIFQNKQNKRGTSYLRT